MTSPEACKTTLHIMKNYYLSTENARKPQVKGHSECDQCFQRDGCTYAMCQSCSSRASRFKN